MNVCHAATMAQVVDSMNYDSYGPAVETAPADPDPRAARLSL